MKLLKKANGKQTIKMSHKEWVDMGKKAGWMKESAYNGLGGGATRTMEDRGYDFGMKTFDDLNRTDRIMSWGDENQTVTQTPLNKAIQSNDPRVVQKAISSGAQGDSDTLNYATNTNHPAIVKLVIDAGAQPDVDTLNWAIISNHPRIVELVIGRGVRPDENSARYARESNHPEIVKLVTQIK